MTTVREAVDGGMVAFDLETTGTDPETARIVTATVVKVTADGAHPHTWLINPEIPIPAEATAVHGYTTEVAQDQGLDRRKYIPEIAERITQAAVNDGQPLVVMNAAYDLTVLDRELRSVGASTTGLELINVLDPMVIDRHLDKWRRGKRTLTDLCLHYQVNLNGAHNAEEDALAAARLAWRMARVWPQMGDTPLTEFHDMQRSWRLIWADEFRDYLRSQGKPAGDVSGDWPIRSWREESADAVNG